MISSLQVDGPEVTINRQRAIVIKSPRRGKGWLAAAGCCKPNVHRDLQMAIDRRRIEAGETFAIDWNRVMLPKAKEDYGGNLVILESRPECLRALSASAPGQPHREGRRGRESR